MKNLKAIPLKIASKILKCLEGKLLNTYFQELYLEKKTTKLERAVSSSWIPGQF